jgi:hypothetical protein
MSAAPWLLVSSGGTAIPRFGTQSEARWWGNGPARRGEPFAGGTSRYWPPERGRQRGAAAAGAGGAWRRC